MLLSLLNFGVMAEGFCIFIFGDLVTLWIGAKRPKFASQRKYLLPSTAPSFFPIAASNSTPAHSPLAKSVGPRYLKQKDTTYGFNIIKFYLKVPVLVPAILLATMTLSPTANAPPPARLVVLSAGDRVGAGEADRRRSDTLPEGLAVPTLEDVMDQQCL